jgi:serine/threonine protein kinase
LGEGSYGVVYKGRCRGLPFAIKILKLPKGEERFSEEQLKNFREEIKVMFTIHHPSIALFVGAYVSYDSIKIGFFYFFLFFFYYSFIFYFLF